MHNLSTTAVKPTMAYIFGAEIIATQSTDVFYMRVQLFSLHFMDIDPIEPFNLQNNPTKLGTIVASIL